VIEWKSAPKIGEQMWFVSEQIIKPGSTMKKQKEWNYLPFEDSYLSEYSPNT